MTGIGLQEWHNETCCCCLVAKLCPTHCDPMDCIYSPPGSSVHGIFQAQVLEWVSISFSRGSSQPRDQTRISCIASGFLPLRQLGSPYQIVSLLNPLVNTLPAGKLIASRNREPFVVFPLAFQQQLRSDHFSAVQLPAQICQPHCSGKQMKMERRLVDRQVWRSEMADWSQWSEENKFHQ